ncbi:alanine--tRNA ligase [Marinicrinis sediminis]|uniref:Alanine--tRNA ligase n=1 Tax=Marinicrinis sediminis TaxID=1652465 RepID=A0ABW5R5N3_9BACL
MKSSEIRQKWLDFFASKNHKIEPSASLVPHNDPSLLWINAGMAPLKPYFDGRIKPDNPRIANAQKCIRTNDIENVGKTRRHQTFFEMLGNFSIGDYFKEEAITWAWEFLTDPKWIGFDPERLSVTIHPEDEEAFDLWNKKIGLPADRIVKLDENFWDIGEGPCGPCTEIFYDRGESFGDASDPECYPGGENERYLEVWNNVFSQFNHNKDGSYTPLPAKNIDTGAGLERFTSILQEVDSNFDTDLFQPIIQETSRIAGVKYKEQEEMDVALKVIADHVRTVAFAAGDGVLPSNEGRGYVIRRLLRRAVRFGKVLGIDQPFLYRLVPVVADIMGTHYTELVEKQDFIVKVIRSEEERFHETLSEGLSILEQLAAQAKQEGSNLITGSQCFKLYDTYGFPLDLTEDYAAEQGLSIDREGFEAEMAKQRERARAARQDTGSMNIQGGPLSDFTAASEFAGYEELRVNSQIIALIVEDQLVEEVGSGQVCQVVLDQTPFYAESGGQVSDHGVLAGQGLKAVVQDVKKAPHGQHVHTVEVQEGVLRLHETVEAVVDSTIREAVIKNHTATHLLHRALKMVLGEHANQAGSLVAPDRLRFDFSHFGSVTIDELEQIEQIVNEQIWANTTLAIARKSLDEAKEMGAMALFGEKYGDVVRVVQIGDFSLELCGGCHVQQTAQIGMFKILSESGIGSGIRRIEAVTGKGAYQYMEEQLDTLKQAAALLKSKVQDVPARIESMSQQLREAGKENESLKAKLSQIEAGSLTDQVQHVDGVPLLAVRLDVSDMDSLRNVADEMKSKLQSAIIVLGAAIDDKVQLVGAVTPDLVKRGYHAGKLIKETAAVCGGGGGGRPDMAQAGGKDIARLDEAIAKVPEFLKQQVEA